MTASTFFLFQSCLCYFSLPFLINFWIQIVVFYKHFSGNITWFAFILKTDWEKLTSLPCWVFSFMNIYMLKIQSRCPSISSSSSIFFFPSLSCLVIQDTDLYGLYQGLPYPLDFNWLGPKIATMRDQTTENEEGWVSLPKAQPLLGNLLPQLLLLSFCPSGLQLATLSTILHWTLLSLPEPLKLALN